MYCPNKNSIEYLEMVSVLGEAITHYIWDKNNGNPIHSAPNGKPSKLFNDLIEQLGSKEEAIKAKARVYSKDFRNWFGNWLSNDKSNVSKVVDENGEPLIENIIQSQQQKEEFDLNDEKIGKFDKNNDNIYYGLDINNDENLKFQTITLNRVTDLLDKLGININLLENIKDTNGNIVEGALAAANFINNTVDVIDDIEKRPTAWNKLPEETAHWWYRLLKEDSELKKTLWESVKTNKKALELYNGKYGKLVNKPEDLTEEAIGQLIAISINKLEKNNKDNTVWFEKFIKWIKDIISKYFNNYDPFELAAMKILAHDTSDLLTVSEYGQLTNLFNNFIPSEIEEYTIEDTDWYKNLDKRFKVRKKVTDKVLRRLALNSAENLTKIPLTEQDKTDLILKNNYEELTPSLDSLMRLRKKYNKQILNLKSPIKIEGKKFDNEIYNIVRNELLNQNIIKIPIDDFLTNVFDYLHKYYLLGFAEEKSFLNYRISNTFKYIKGKIFKKDSDINVDELDNNNITEDIVRNLGLKDDSDVKHRKISLRFNNEYLSESSHFNYSPSAWGNITYFKTKNIDEKNAVLIHEIQNDFFEKLNNNSKETTDDNFKIAITKHLQLPKFFHILNGTYKQFKETIEENRYLLGSLEKSKRQLKDFYELRNSNNRLIVNTNLFFKKYKYELLDKLGNNIDVNKAINEINNLSRKIGMGIIISTRTTLYKPHEIKSTKQLLFRLNYNVNNKIKKDIISINKRISTQYKIINKLNSLDRYDQISEKKFKQLFDNYNKNLKFYKNKIKINNNFNLNLNLEKKYFNPVVDRLLQTIIKEKGRNFPIYFSGAEITLLTQGSERTSKIYAGPEEVKKGLADKIGALFIAMKKTKGIKLEYVEEIPGFVKKVGGYKVNIENYNREIPVLYGLDNKNDSVNNLKLQNEKIEKFNENDDNIYYTKSYKNPETFVNKLNNDIYKILRELNVSIEFLDDLTERTGYSIASATDLLTKTIILQNENKEKAFTKEAAYLIFEFLGRKNILRKDLIASIHLLDDYEQRISKYKSQKLSEYSKKELVVVDYLQEQLINNFENPVVLKNSVVSKDATAKNKFEYILLKIKQWWANIVRKYFKIYKQNYVKNTINQIALDVLNNNYRLFSKGNTELYKNWDEGGKINLKTRNILNADKELNKNKKRKIIFEKLKNLGYIPSGSYALSKQGNVYRDKMKDLDFVIPYEELQNKKYLTDLKNNFKSIKFGKPYQGITFNIATLTVELDGEIVDLFLMLEESNKKDYTTKEGLHNWLDIFEAKIKIGSKKHMNDLFNFIPFQNTIGFRKGMRHFNFDYIESSYNYDYKDDSTMIYDIDLDVYSTLKDSEYTKNIFDKANNYLEINNIDKENSLQFNSLVTFHKGDKNKATIDYWKTFSENFKIWFGEIESRKHLPKFTFGKIPLKYYNKKSTMVDINGEPKIYYHGTGTIFDTFNKDYFLTGEGAMAFGAGFYGTNYKPTADNYRDTSNAAIALYDKLIKEKDERLLNLLSELGKDFKVTKLISHLGSTPFPEINSTELKLLEYLGLTETKNLYVQLSNPLDWFSSVRESIKNIIETKLKIIIPNRIKTEGELYEFLQKKLKITDKELSYILYQNGIDGTIHYTGGGNATAGFQHKKGELHFVTFEPIQLKSVNNSGQYSIHNNNIYDPVIDKINYNDTNKSLNSHILFYQQENLINATSNIKGLNGKDISIKEFTKKNNLDEVEIESHIPGDKTYSLLFNKAKDYGLKIKGNLIIDESGLSSDNLAQYNKKEKKIGIMANFGRLNQLTKARVLGHEILHGVISEEFKAKSKQEQAKIEKNFNDFINSLDEHLDNPEIKRVYDIVKGSNWQEIITYAFSDKKFADALNEIILENDTEKGFIKTFWDKLKELILSVLSDDYTKFDELQEILDNNFKIEFYDYGSLNQKSTTTRKPIDSVYNQYNEVKIALTKQIIDENSNLTNIIAHEDSLEILEGDPIEIENQINSKYGEKIAYYFKALDGDFIDIIISNKIANDIIKNKQLENSPTNNITYIPKVQQLDNLYTFNEDGTIIPYTDEITNFMPIVNNLKDEYKNTTVEFEQKINLDLKDKISKLRKLKKETKDTKKRLSINKEIAELNLDIERRDRNLSISNTLDFTKISNINILANNDILLCKKLMKKPLKNKLIIQNIVDYYKGLGDFRVDNVNPIFGKIEKDKDFNFTHRNLEEIITNLKNIRDKVIEEIENPLITKVKNEVIKVINNNKNIEKLEEGLSDLSDLIKPEEDINIWDMLMHNTTINTFSKDSILPKIMWDEMSKTLEDNRADTLKKLKVLDGLQYNVDKKLKQYKALSLIHTSYDLFFQLDKLNLKTGRLVHLFSKEWFDQFNEYTKIDFSATKSKKRNAINKRNAWLGSYTDVIDIRKMPEIQKKYKGTPFEKYFINEPDYKNQLVGKISQELYDNYVIDAINKIEEYKTWTSMLLKNIVIDKISNKQKTILNNQILAKNPFAATASFSTKKNTGLTFKNNETYPVNMEITYINFIPKKEITVKDYDTGNTYIENTGYYDKNFEYIKNDKELFAYWLGLVAIVEDINNNFSGDGVILPVNSLPALEKLFLESFLESNKNVGFLNRFWKSIINQIREFGKKFTTKQEETVLATDTQGINRNIPDKRLTQFKRLRDSIIAKWVNLDGTLSKIDIADLTSEQIQYIATLFNIEPNISSLKSFLKTDFIDFKSLANTLTNSQIAQESSQDIPRIIRTAAKLASEYTSRKELEPIMNVFKNYYTNIERDKTIKGKQSQIGSFIREKLSNQDSENKRILANKRMEWNFNKAVRGQFDKPVTGLFTGIKSIDVSTKKKFKRFFNFIATGKIFSKEDMKTSDNLTFLLNDLINKITNESAIEHINNNERIPYNIIKAEIDDIEQQLLNAYNSTLTEINALGRRIGFSSIMNGIFSALIFKGLAYNLSSGITNRIEGKFANMIIDSTGLYWTPGNIGEAELFTSQGFRKRIMRKSDFAKQWDILKHIVDDYNIIQDASNELQKNSVKSTFKTEKFTPYYLSVSSIEFRNQGAMVIARLKDITIKDKNNVEYKMFENGKFPAFEIINNNLRLKKEFRTSENINTWENIETEEYRNFQVNTVAAIIAGHGDFHNLGGMMLKTNTMGKALGMFKTWLPMQIWQRIGIEQSDLNTTTGKFKGRWRSFTPLTGAAMGASAGIIGGPGLAAIGGLVGASLASFNNVSSEIGFVKEIIIVSKNILFKTLFTPLHLFGIGTKWGQPNLKSLELNPIDTANLQANIVDISLLLATILFKLFISSLRAGEDDDDKDKLKYKIYLLFENKLMNLIGNSTFYTEPKMIYDSYTQNSLYKWIGDIDKTLNDLQDSIFKDFTTNSAKEAQKDKIRRDFKRVMVPAFMTGGGLGNYVKTDWTSNDFWDREIITEPKKKRKKEAKELKKQQKKNNNG